MTSNMMNHLSTGKNADESNINIAVIPYRELEPVTTKDVPKYRVISYNPKHDLDEIIANLAETFKLDVANEKYALLLTEKSDVRSFPRYITKDNRNAIANGTVVQLYYSPHRFVVRLLEQMKANTDEGARLATLKDILDFFCDRAFVAEFNEQNGVDFIAKCLQKKEFTTDDEFCFALDIFLKAIEHEIVDWTQMDKQFIEVMAQSIYNKTEINKIKDEDRKILVASLSILESWVSNCSNAMVQEIENQISLPSLNNILKNDRFPQVQQNVIALINAMLSRTISSKRNAMAATVSSRQFKDTILQYIVNRKNADTEKSMCGSEIAHQLYVLQTLLFRLYEDKLYSGSQFDDARKKVMDICSNYSMTAERDSFEQKLQSTFLLRSQTSIASNASGASSTSTEKAFSEDFERIGFPNTTHPWETFSEPPGALVIDLLHYFSKTHTDAFVRFVFENSSLGDRVHDCPLVLAAFRLTHLLCDLLGVGKAPRDEGREFYTMLFETDRPLEELFSIGLSLFNRTWHEINATSADIDIVCDFLHEKLCNALANQIATQSFDCFRKELSKITYADINRRWNEERDKRDRQKEELPVIKELRTLLKPETTDIVRQHRLAYLIRGTRFDRYTPKGVRVKDKFWYCRLSPNHKTLLYGDCDEDCKNLDDSILSKKFNISSIEEVVVGKDCPHMRDTKGKKSTTQLAFALISKDEDGDNLCFVASNPEIYSYWIDGLNALLDHPMTSSEAEKDTEMLLDLDIKLRLLDMEGLSIPEKMPEIPPPPSNYDFAFLKST